MHLLMDMYLEGIMSMRVEELSPRLEGKKTNKQEMIQNNSSAVPTSGNYLEDYKVSFTLSVVLVPFKICS